VFRGQLEFGGVVSVAKAILKLLHRHSKNQCIFINNDDKLNKSYDSAIDAATICSNALLYVISGDIKHRDITGDIWYSVGAAEDRTIENLSTATNVLGARSSIQSTRSRNHLYYTHIYIYT